MLKPAPCAIDFARLGARVPRIVFDLPGGAPRLMQTAEGYRAMLVTREAIVEDGVPTNPRPGRLVRGGRDGGRGPVRS